jgi:cleavage and polyadenylation specificity factor subunit 1
VKNKSRNDLNMFSICKQTASASGVEFAIKCNFFNNVEKNLVTAGANVLKVYRLLPDVELNTKEKFSG